jgi:sec-independent protein translocase protein TatA
MGIDHLWLIILVLLVALVVFGPKRLPELGHSLGRAITEFRHATQSTVDEVRSLGSTSAAGGHAAPTAEGTVPGPGVDAASSTPATRSDSAD